MMKKLRVIFWLLLSIVMVLALMTGCGNEPSVSSAPSNTENDTQEQTNVVNDVSDVITTVDNDVITTMEYERGIQYGFLPEELAEVEPDVTTVTWKQYCSILGNMIRLQNESVMPAWEEMTVNAQKTGMKRDGAMIALLFAGKTLEIDNFNIDTSFIYEGYDWGNCASWDYPLFPWNSPYLSDEELMNDPNNAVGPAYAYCACRASLVSERPLLDVDFGTGDMHLEDELTLRDAMVSAVRLYESVDHEASNYISVYDAAAYDKGIITDELLNAHSDLPEVTQQALPAGWKGAGISARKDGKHLQQDFKEADLAFLAENGFNFSRIFLGIFTFRYPDFPSDVTQINETELLELDQLIAWGIEYGVHIQLSMSDVPSGLESLDLNEDEWEIFRAYWEMLARRYAGIPSRYLSFDLTNELQPSEENLAEAASNMAEIAADIRAADPERVLLISFNDNPIGMWVESMAELGIALGCHPYTPQYLNNGMDSFSAATEYWPYPYFPAILYPDESIKISGDIGGNTLKIDFWVYRPFVVNFNDGSTLIVDVQADYIDEMSCDWRFNEPYEIKIPEGVTELEIIPQNQECTIYELIMECNGKMTGLVPVDSMVNRSRGSSELIWNEDGWSSEKNYGVDMIYNEVIKPIKDVADEYSVGFMCNEFGIYACNVGWNISIVENYTDDMLEMLEEHDIPWCLCEVEGTPYRFLTVPDGRRYEWDSATLESKTYVFEDGTARTFQYCKELLEVFRKYTGIN